MTSAMQAKEALRIMVAIVALVIVVIIFAVTIGFFMHYCPVIEQSDELRTGRTCYIQGEEDVVFTFRNTGDNEITFNSDLGEVIEIFGPDGDLVLMIPPILDNETIQLGPNETLEWSWFQIYYLWESDGEGNITFDDRNDDQVPLGKYTARISFGEIEEEVIFRITL
jgi:hypothetical protein